MIDKRGLRALDEFRLLINNYEDKWDGNTTSFFRSCHDAIKDALEDYYEIKEISKNYHFNDLGHDVFKVETDRKWQLKFDAGICDVQEDYKKARAFDIIKKAFDSSSTYTYKLQDSLECGWITQEEYDLLKGML